MSILKKAFKRISAFILVVAMFAVQSVCFAAIKDINGAEIIINMKNVSMLELPLLKLEEAINQNKL